MKKIILILGVFLFLGGLILAQNQEDNLGSLASQNKISSCLKGEIVGPKAPPKLPEGEKGDPCRYFGSSVRLTGSCESPTGCKIYRQHLPGKSCGIKDEPFKEVEDSYFPSKKNYFPYGSIDVTVQGQFQAHTQYVWYAVGDAPTTGQGIDAQNKTQQLGTIENLVDVSGKKCVRIAWDPFGRVFDALSLEPISGVQLGVYYAKNNKLVDIFDNPTKTDERGSYNLLVGKEDDYYLEVSPPNTHLFTENVNLHPNYSKIYSDIYSPKKVFHEKPLPTLIPENFDWSAYHHDIPLQPKGAPYKGAVAEVWGTLDQFDAGDTVSYSGIVTFPMAKVCLIGETTGKLIGCTNADKFGVFEISVNKAEIPLEFIEVKVEKVDLTNLP